MSSNPFLDRSSLVKIPVSELKLGMFVADLDRPWLETPFLIQGFTIKGRSEVRKLAEYCRYVYVDAGGRRWGAKANPFKDPFKSNRRSPSWKRGGSDRRKQNEGTSYGLVETIGSREPHYIKSSVYEEHAKAREIYNQAKEFVKRIIHNVQVVNVVDFKLAKTVVHSCMESILRNPDALMWITRIKSKDDYLVEHCLNVSILAIAFGRHLRLPERELEKLGLSGLLFDVGKLKTPADILNKPGQLTPEELELMKRHTIEGRDLLRKSSGAHQYVVDVALNHHERVDGKGYPRELVASELSDYTRIVSLIDSFDAMTSDRVHTKAKSNLDALKEIYKDRDRQFDENLGLEFISVIGPYPPGTIVALTNGAIGIVLHSQEHKRHLPTIELVRDQSGKDIKPRVIDLLETESGKLEKNFLIKRMLKNGECGIAIKDFPVQRILNPDNTLQTGVS